MMVYQIKWFVLLLLLPGLGVAQEVFYDPMRPLIKMPIVTYSQKALKINMIFDAKPSLKKRTKSWAIINGRKYFIGDMVQGRKLVDISSGKVFFEYKGKKYKQSLVNNNYVKESKNKKNNYESFYAK